MFKRPILTALCLVMTLFTSFGAVNNQHVQVSIFGKYLAPIRGIALIHPIRIEPNTKHSDPLEVVMAGENSFLGKSGQWSFCDYSLPENPTYDVELLNTEVDKSIQSGEVFMVNMTLKNKGNARLFSSKSDCDDMPVFNLGTQGSTDRASVFGKSSVAMSGWTSPNRIKMLNDYVDPGEDFQVMFQSIAPGGDNIYNEWLQPVVENVAWLSSPFKVEIKVGSPTDEMIKNMSFVKEPISIAASDLIGQAKSFNIDLSEQTMRVKFGDITIWKMLISSGDRYHETPVGNWTISSKQELRIGAASPHYRMPYFMMWRKDGYGIHALPYLANDGGTFWNEAREHIGRPVSHGCIRSLPEDAAILYSFAEIGTPVNVQY